MTWNLEGLVPDVNHTEPGKFYGVYVGLVTNNKDPEKLGRVKVNYPWLHMTPEDESYWARPVYPMNGAARGFWFLPEIGDEILLGFEHGDIRFPYNLGGLYNGKDTPPSFGEPGADFNEDGKNDLRGIRSRSGHQFVFHDGGSYVRMQDKKGNFVIIDTDSDAVNMQANQDVTIQARGGDVTIEAAVDVLFTAKVNIEGTAGANISTTSGADTGFSATGTMLVKSGAAMSYTAGSTMSISSKAAMTVTAGGPLACSSSGPMSVGSKAGATVNASGNATFNAGGPGSFGSKGNATFGCGGNFAALGKSELSAGAAASVSLNAPMVDVWGAASAGVVAQGSCTARGSITKVN